jgi:uncharacterized alpha-E superfamily protein
MLSRVAERLYWMARYVERTENTARLLNAFNTIMLDLPKGVGMSWSQLIDITGGGEEFASRYRSANERNTLAFLLSDPDNPASIISSVTLASENVRTTRDIVPNEGFETVNELRRFVRRRLAARSSRKPLYEFLAQIVRQCQTVTGLLAGTMSHGSAYQFVRLGRNLERADMTTRILDVGSATLIASDAELERLEHRLWTWLLSALSAHQMYRQSVRRQVTGRIAAGYLLHDSLFPRAVMHTLGEMRGCLKHLPRKTPTLNALTRAERRVRDTDIDEVFPNRFHAYIDDIQLDLAGIHDCIQNTWFEPGPAPKAVNKAAPGSAPRVR